MRNGAAVGDLTAERIKRNNAVFREANERIHEAVQHFEHEVSRIPFLCECPVEDCVELVRLSDEEYRAIRAGPRHYVTAAGHESAEKPVGRVVAHNDGYVIVEKP
jgi:hypothetical protein